jgi:hypothetical protein
MEEDAAMSQQLDEMEARVAAWVASEEGTKQLLAAKYGARTASEKILADAKINAEQLWQPMTC